LRIPARSLKLVRNILFTGPPAANFIQGVRSSHSPGDASKSLPRCGGPSRDGSTAQQWSLSATGTSAFAASFVLTDLLSGWVIDVADESTTAGAPVDQWSANGGAHQRWTLST
jgi:hypothetical protein